LDDQRSIILGRAHRLEDHSCGRIARVNLKKLAWSP
jgi:hypothetical protein